MSEKPKKERIILKRCVVHTNRKGPGFVLTDKGGKVYFVTKNDEYTDYLKDHLGKSILVWVTKDLPKIGYCRVSINNMPLEDFINNIRDNLDRNALLKLTTIKSFRDVEANFYNSMFGYDKNFLKAYDTDILVDTLFNTLLPTDKLAIKILSLPKKAEDGDKRASFLNRVVTVSLYINWYYNKIKI